jgi:MFS family permease
MHTIQGEFNLSNIQNGFLATAFLVGLLLASPLFSESCKHYSAFRLIAIGMGTWTLATAGCGLSWGFGSLIACRMLVGVGEASFVALASPFIGAALLQLRALMLVMGAAFATTLLLLQACNCCASKPLYVQPAADT